MISKLTLTICCSILLLPAAGIAGESLKDRFSMQSGGNKFVARETTMDIFGSLATPEHNDIFDGHLGIGLGVNYFFSRWLGAGVDTGIEKIDWPNHFNGSVLARYPIEKWSLAPYGFAGFGRQFHDTSQWTYHFGGGLDYRLNRKTGIFLDVRRTMPDVSREFTLWRFGLRLGF